MDTTTQKKLIPKNVQDFVSSSVYAKLITSICDKNHFDIDQTGELNMIVTQIVCGITEAKDLENNIQENLSLSSDKVRNIVEDIHTMIFSLVKSSLNISLTTQSPTQNNTAAEPHLTREGILSGIENPNPMNGAAKPTSSFVTNRLSGLTRMPKEDIVVTDKHPMIPPAPTTPAEINPKIQEATVPPTTMTPKPTYKDSDPYRENL